MPQSEEAVIFELQSGKRGNSGSDKGVLTVTRRTNEAGKKGWRAVINDKDADARFFGCWRPTIVEAVSSHLRNVAHRVDQSEQDRILTVAVDMQTRRSGSLHQNDCVELSPQAQLVSASPLMQGLPQRNGVRIIHQVYGVFGDGKCMSALFQQSHKRWKDLAKSMSVQYHLWNADEQESLIAQRYPQYWELYCNVRYPIMRCDIGRLLILHTYGGLYADLDTTPNRTWYEQAELAFAQVQDPKRKSLSANAKRLKAVGPQPSGSQPRRGRSTFYAEMEIIVAKQGNDMLLRWMDHIVSEIADKPYTDPRSFWWDAKMRYVYNTTGPTSLKRFLQLPSNKEAMKGIKYLSCNHFKNGDQLTAEQKRCYDVLSLESNSYFTKEHSIHVPVGWGATKLPLSDLIRKRLRFKSAEGGGNPDAQCASTQVPRPRVPVSEDGLSVRPTPAAAPSSSQQAVIEGNVHAPQAATTRLEEELEQHRSREAKLKAHVKHHANTMAMRIVMDSLPDELAEWLHPEWKIMESDESRRAAVSTLPKRQRL